MLSAGPLITHAVDAKTLAGLPRTQVEGIEQRVIPQRLLDAVPLLLSATIISFFIWGPLLAPLPLAIFILLCQCYWLWRSQMIGIHAVRGFFVARRHDKIDWRAQYEQERTPRALDWDSIWHVVIIPNYTETTAKMSVCLDSLAESEAANRIIAVLAMEEREGEEGRRRADYLLEKYRGRLGGMMATFHPVIAGEVAGKSSNEAWAAKQARNALISSGDYDINYLTITSCDADTHFHPRYFSCLTYKFALEPNRYRRFWQAPIFYYNNIWRLPSPLRLPHALGGMSDLARLSRKFMRMVFPQSTYSLSFRMADEVGYWDTDIIPEDWHMFLKTFYALNGDVDVDTIYLPMYMDGMRAKTYWGTFPGYYRQVRRWAWGCSDFRYAINQSIKHPEVPRVRNMRRIWSLTESHLMRSVSWFFVTVGRDLPLIIIAITGFGGMPVWFYSVSAWILSPCLGALIMMNILDFMLRPKRPADFPKWLYAVQYAQWFFLPVVTFFFTVLPALDAQLRLALGKRMEYKVTEKA